jgi:uncharacterized membrane protein YdjX (TVP38/TMEM64 family)
MDDVNTLMTEPAATTEVPPPTLWERCRATVKRLGPAGPLAVLAATFPPLGGFVLLGLVTRIGPWLNGFGWLGPSILVVGFSLAAGLSLLPTYACSCLAGYAFKFTLGFSASMAAFVAAALVAYVVSARAAGDRVIEIVREHPKWEAVRVALLGAGFWRSLGIITLIRVPPTSPFAAANFIMGTIRAPLVPYLLGSLIGMAPRTAAVVWMAGHAATTDFSEGKNIWNYAIAAGSTLVVVAVIGHIATRAVHRVTRAPSEK